jgi:hypothetical protein
MKPESTVKGTKRIECQKMRIKKIAKERDFTKKAVSLLIALPPHSKSVARSVAGTGGSGRRWAGRLA